MLDALLLLLLLALPGLLAASPLIDDDLPEPLVTAVPADAAREAVDRGYHEVAELELRAALESAPEDPQLLYRLGTALQGRGESREAVRVLARARRLAPGSVPIRIRLGMALSDEEDHEEAVRELGPALDAEPDTPDLGLRLARALHCLDREKEALLALARNHPSTARQEAKARALRQEIAVLLACPERPGRDLVAPADLDPLFRRDLVAERFLTRIATSDDPDRVRFEGQFDLVQDGSLRRAPIAHLDDPGPSRPSSPGHRAFARSELRITSGTDWELAGTYELIHAQPYLHTRLRYLDHQFGLRYLRHIRLRGRPAAIGLEGTVDQLEEDDTDLLEVSAVTASLAAGATPDDTTVIYGQLMTRVVDEAGINPLQRQSGTDLRLGLTHFRRLARTRHVSAGYAYDAEESDGRTRSHRGHRLQLGGRWDLKHGVRLAAWWMLHRRIHDAADPLTGFIRRDTEVTWIVRATRRIDARYTGYIQFSRLAVDSSIAGFDREHNQALLGLAIRL